MPSSFAGTSRVRSSFRALFRTYVSLFGVLPKTQEQYRGSADCRSCGPAICRKVINPVNQPARWEVFAPRLYDGLCASPHKYGLKVFPRSESNDPSHFRTKRKRTRKRPLSPTSHRLAQSWDVDTVGIHCQCPNRTFAPEIDAGAPIWLYSPVSCAPLRCGWMGRRWHGLCVCDSPDRAFASPATRLLHPRHPGLSIPPTVEQESRARAHPAHSRVASRAALKLIPVGDRGVWRVHQTHVPAKAHSPEAPVRFHGPDVHQGWPPGARRAAPQGPARAVGVGREEVHAEQVGDCRGDTRATIHMPGRGACHPDACRHRLALRRVGDIRETTSHRNRP